MSVCFSLSHRTINYFRQFFVCTAQCNAVNICWGRVLVRMCHYSHSERARETFASISMWLDETFAVYPSLEFLSHLTCMFLDCGRKVAEGHSNIDHKQPKQTTDSCSEDTLIITIVFTLKSILFVSKMQMFIFAGTFCLKLISLLSWIETAGLC